jgi:plastocyanin
MESIARARLAAIAILVLVTAGCGSASHAASSTTTTSTPTSSRSTDAVASAPHAHGTLHVTMRALWFYPTTVHARLDQKVVWTNDDSSPHNVTYVSGPRFRSSRRIMRPGARFSLRLTRPGTIQYYCSLHPWMKATIVVAP